MIFLLIIFLINGTALYIGKAKISNNAEVIITNFLPKGFFTLILITEDIWIKYNYSNVLEFECLNYNNFNISFGIFEKITQIPYSFKILNSNLYYFFIFNCTTSLILIQDYEIIIKNSWGYLNELLYPVFYLSWISTIYFLILVILYTINILNHPLIKLKIHRLIYICLITEFLSNLSISLLFTLFNNFLLSSNILIISNIIRSFSFFLISFLFLSIASGLSISIENLSSKRLFIITIISILLGIFDYFFCSSFQLEFVQNNFLFLQFLNFNIYIIFLILFINFSEKSTSILNSHLIMIFSKGIDPITTPTYRNIEMLEELQKFTLTSFFFIMLFQLFYQIGIFTYWGIFLFFILIKIFLYTEIAYKYRIRKSMTNNYGIDEDIYIVDDNDNNNELNPWNPSMIIPNLPLNFNKNNQIQSNQ